MITTAGLHWEKLTLKLRNPFRLSYGVSETRQAYWLRLADDSGWGEGTIPPYYGVPDAALEAYWANVAVQARPLPESVEQIEDWIGTDGPATARCALELALYDRLARQAGLPLHQLLGLPAPLPLQTSFTISIDSPEAMAAQAAAIPDWQIIKLKLGSDDDIARLSAVRTARPDARLRVDANAGWTLADARSLLRALEPFDLEMIEQPLPKDDFAGLGALQDLTPLPIVADESVQTLADVEHLADAGVRGVNVKLMKVGGLTPALRILRLARSAGMQVMLGSMVETSLGATAMAHLAGLADWLDLDAPLLISNDPFEGITFDKNLRISLPQRPGIGVLRRNPA